MSSFLVMVDAVHCVQRPKLSCAIFVDTVWFGEVGAENGVRRRCGLNSMKVWGSFGEARQPRGYRVGSRAS
ncbi:hypothetical protein HBH43_156270 [Parastagonospora nodorum]|nr:hypothetical protein HBH43_156270 [Parastagonospora nodorum]